MYKEGLGLGDVDKYWYQGDKGAKEVKTWGGDYWNGRSMARAN